MIGATISHYRVTDRLGGGGMGVVYKAEDTRLGRPVALKFLPEHLAGDEQALERFQREARAASALNHPNICSIFDIDESEGAPFLAMEFLDGTTLKEHVSRGPMPFEELLDVSLQIVDGLAVAHEEGILHRDLKPANLFLTTRGFAKILDFGLAKLDPGTATSDSIAQTATLLADDLTQEGSTVGTVAYMAPEQARGEAVDARSDLFSLGTVLYELATGKQAFGGATTALTFDAILHKPSVSPLALRPELPEEFVRVVDKALEKDPAMRYQSAAELKSDLLRLKRDASSGQSVAAPGRTPRTSSFRAPLLLGIALVVLVAAAIALWPRGEERADPAESPPVAAIDPTIAVLPFHNLAGAKDLDYLRFAVPDEITTALSYAPTLDVRPFSITRQYASPDVDPISAGRDVDVETVVTGQFSREGDDLQVTLEAIDIADSSVLWRDRVSAGAGDLIALRELLAETVRVNLLPLFDASPRDAATTPSDPVAYQKYLQSLAIGNDEGPTNQEAIRLLEEASELDPGFAPTWVQLSWRYSVWYAYGGGGRHAHELAIETARRALDLDPDQFAATRQLVLMYAESSRLREAYDVAREAVDRNPGSGEAHFALSYVYRYAGLLADAAEECEAAWAIDSTNAQFRSCAVVFYRLGDFSRARDFTRLDEGSRFQHVHDGNTAFYRGDLEEAHRIWQSWKGEPPIRNLVAECGPDVTPESRAAASEPGPSFLLNVDPEANYNGARRFTYCGAHDLAIRSLRVAIEKSFCAVSAFESELPFATLRDHPEFDSLHQAAISCQQRFLEHRDKSR